MKIWECTLSECFFSAKVDYSNYIKELSNLSIPVIEIGRLKNQSMEKGKTIFFDANIPKVKRGLEDSKLSLYVNDLEEYNLDFLSKAGVYTADIVRVRRNNEEYPVFCEYVNRIKEKGYDVAVEYCGKSNFAEELLDLVIGTSVDYVVFSKISLADWNSIEKLLLKISQAKRCKFAFILDDNSGIDMIKQVEGKIQNDIFIMSSFGESEDGNVIRTDRIFYTLYPDSDFEIVLQIFDYYLKDRVMAINILQSLEYQTKCNKKYVEFFAKTKMFSIRECWNIIQKLSDEEKKQYIGNENLIENIRHYRKNYFEKKIGLFYAVYDFKQLKEFIDNIWGFLNNYCLDIWILNFAKTNLEREKIENYLKHYKNFHLLKNNNTFNQKSFYLSLYKRFGFKYNYIWVIRENIIPNFEVVLNDLYLSEFVKNDLYILSSHKEVDDHTFETFHNSKLIFCKFFKELAVNGNFIINSRLLQKVINEECVDNRFWILTSIFKYLETNRILCTRICGDFFKYNLSVKNIKFLVAKRNSLKKWIYELEQTFKELNSYYGEYNNVVRKSFLNDVLSSRAFLFYRMNYDYDWHKYIEYIRDNKLYSRKNRAKCKIISILPRFIAKTIFLNYYRPFCLNRINNFDNLLERILYKKSSPKEKLKYHSNPTGNKKIHTLTDNRLFSKNELCVVIPTANRDEIIYDCLQQMANIYAKYGVDVCIYDSSKDEKTELVVTSYVRQGYKNIIYKRYTGKEDKLSLDEKVVSAYKELADVYKYIWIIRDRMLIQFDHVGIEIKQAINKHSDFIVMHAYNKKHFFQEKEYRSNVEFFKEQFCDMTVLGTTIVKGEVIKEIIVSEPIDYQKNYSLWQPVAFFSYITKHEFKAYVYSGDCFHYHKSAFVRGGGSFWLSFFLWQWGKRLWTMMNRLPEEYGELRWQVMKENVEQFNLYNIWFLLGARARGGITLKKYKKYYYYIHDVSDVSKKKMFLISIIPKKLAKWIVDNPDSILVYVWNLYQTKRVSNELSYDYSFLLF